MDTRLKMGSRCHLCHQIQATMHRQHAVPAASRLPCSVHLHRLANANFGGLQHGHGAKIGEQLSPGESAVAGAGRAQAACSVNSQQPA